MPCCHMVFMRPAPPNSITVETWNRLVIVTEFRIVWTNIIGMRKANNKPIYCLITIKMGLPHATYVLDQQADNTLTLYYGTVEYVWR